MRLGVSTVALMAFAASASAQGVHEDLVAKHSAANDVPEALVRRVIRIESRGNPSIVSRGNYGLMQIRLRTARQMGYEGEAQGLLDADTNMRYAVKYLAGAYRLANCNPDRAVALYQHGYVGHSKTRCEPPARYMVAQAESKPTQMPAVRPNSSHEQPPPSADVLKPKVVHTVPVSKLESALAKSKRPTLPAPALTDPVTSDPVTANPMPTVATRPAPSLPPRSEPAVKVDTFADRIGIVSSPPVVKRGSTGANEPVPTLQAKKPDEVGPTLQVKKPDEVVPTLQVKKPDEVVPTIQDKKPDTSLEARRSDPPVAAKSADPTTKARGSGLSAEARSSEPSAAEIVEAQPSPAKARNRHSARRYHVAKPEPATGLVSLLKKIFTPPDKPRYRRMRRVDALQAVR